MTVGYIRVLAVPAAFAIVVAALVVIMMILRSTPGPGEGAGIEVPTATETRSVEVCPTEPLSDVDGNPLTSFPVVDWGDALAIYGEGKLDSCPIPVDVAPFSRPDGKIDQQDVDSIEARLGLGRGDPPRDGVQYSIQHDPNRDGRIDHADLEIVESRLGETVPAGAFGLDLPQILTCGYEPQRLQITFGESVDKADADRVLEAHRLQEVDVDDKLPFLIVEVNTAGRDDADDLGGIGRELEHLSSIRHVDKNVFCGGPTG